MKQNTTIARAAQHAAAAWLLSLPLVMAACSSADDRSTTDTPADGTPGAAITLTATALQPLDGGGPVATRSAAAATRAATTDGLQGTTFLTGDQLYAWFPGSYATMDHAIYRANGIDGTASTLETDVMPYVRNRTAAGNQTGSAEGLGSKRIPVFAYYPSFVTETTASFSVERDQTTAVAYRYSDLMFGGGRVSTASGNVVTGTTADGTTAPLTMKHQMARLVIQLTPAVESGDVTAAAPKVSAVYVVSGYRTLQFDVAQTASVSLNANCGNVTLSSSATDATGDHLTLHPTEPLADAISPDAERRITVYTGTSAGAVSAAVLLPPQEIGATVPFIQVVTDQGIINYRPQTAQTLAAGTQYTLAATVKRAYANQTVTLDAWQTGATTTAENYREPAIGDLYFSDGTWGTLTDNTSGATKTAADAIGIVFSNQTSTNDQKLGYRHGYVMALKNAGQAAFLSAASTAMQTDKYVTTAQGLFDDFDGLTHCRTAGGTSLNFTSKPAMLAANNYKNTVSPPGGTKSSEWYLPSSGQWRLIIYNLTGIKSGAGERIESGSGSGKPNYNLSDNSGPATAAALNDLLAASLPAGSFDRFGHYQDTGTPSNFVTSTEYDNTYMCRFYIWQAVVLSTSVAEDRNLKTYDQHYVRPVLAF